MYKSFIKSELLVDSNNAMWHHQYKQIKLFGISIKVEEMYSDELDHIELHHANNLKAYQGEKIGFKSSNKVDENSEEPIDE